MTRFQMPGATSGRVPSYPEVERDTVLLVDENDHVIGRHDKLEAHRLGILHSAFSVFVFRRHVDGLELLLQKRAASKYHCAGLWSNTCCSHPAPGEDLRASASARLHEEMGLRVPLIWLGRHTYREVLANGMIEHEVDHLFSGWYGGETIDPHPGEVEDYRWLQIPVLLGSLEATPDLYTPWFADTLFKVLAACRAWD